MSTATQQAKYKADNIVRRDLFAVKVRCGDTGVSSFVVERIFKSMESASNYKRQRQSSLGYSITKKIVHPKQFVVDAFTLYNNIEN